MRITSVVYLVSRKINERYYPVINFATRVKAEQYIIDNPAEYVIDAVDFEYEFELY